MIQTLHRPAWAGQPVPAPLCDPDARHDPGSIDALTGAVPTWRLDEEPIYLEVVRDLGAPGTLTGPAPGDVIAGEVVTQALDLAELFDDAPPTAPIPLIPTTAIPVTGRGGRKRRAPRKQAAS